MIESVGSVQPQNSTEQYVESGVFIVLRVQVQCEPDPLYEAASKCLHFNRILIKMDSETCVGTVQMERRWAGSRYGTGQRLGSV